MAARSGGDDKKRSAASSQDDSAEGQAEGQAADEDDEVSFALFFFHSVSYCMRVFWHVPVPATNVLACFVPVLGRAHCGVAVDPEHGF